MRTWSGGGGGLVENFFLWWCVFVFEINMLSRVFVIGIIITYFEKKKKRGGGGGGGGGTVRKFLYKFCPTIGGKDIKRRHERSWGEI